MSTILAYTSPARGHLYPMVDILLELRARGHRVVVQTLSDERERMKSLGFEHLPISETIERLDLRDFEGSNPIQQFKIALRTWLRRGPHEISDLETSVAAIRPDYLLVDANTLGASAFAQAFETPWALHMPYCLPTASKDAPAFGPGFSPPAGALGRTRDRLVRWMMDTALAGIVRDVNELRASVGADEIGRIEELYQRPPKILYRTAQPFEYRRSDWADNVHALGPGLWAPDAVLPEWIMQIPQPRILVNISTEAQNDGEIIDCAIAAFHGTQFGIICTTSAEDPSRFASAPNVHVAKFLPHAQLMPHVHCVVSHGGMGTVQRALASGVPLCVVPWGRDQNESAQRVVEARAGVRLNPGKLTPQRMRAAVAEALERRDGARRVAQGFQDAGGASGGANLIEEDLPDRATSGIESRTASA